MRYLTPRELLETVADTLDSTVLDGCTTTEAQGQLLAAIGLLRNLASRVEEASDATHQEFSILRQRLPTSIVATHLDIVEVRRRLIEQLGASPSPPTALFDAALAIAENDAPRQRRTNFHRIFVTMGEGEPQ